MIRLTQADAAGSDEGALFVNPDDISAVWIDLASPNHHAIVLLDTGTEFHVKRNERSSKVRSLWRADAPR